MKQTEQVKDNPFEEKSERESYREPTLEKREKLLDVTEGYTSPDPIST